MGKHLPGNPNFIVQNITGAGSLNAANNIYNVAAKDGTVFGTFARGLAMEPLIGTAKVQFDATKFTWLGSGTNEVTICATWHTSPVKTWADALKTQFTVGGEGAGSDPDTYARADPQHRSAPSSSSSPAITAPPTSSWRSSAARSTAAAAGRGRASSRRGRLDRREEAQLPGAHFGTEGAGAAACPANQRLRQRPAEADPQAGDQPAGDGTAVRRARPACRRTASRRCAQAFDATLKDPAFLDEADKLKLEVNPVSGAESTS